MPNEFCPICGAPVSSEGVFVNRLADETIVCEKSLALKAAAMDLGEYIRIGKGEEKTGGRKA